MNAKLGLENAASNLEAKIEIESIAEKAAKEAYKLGEKTLTYYNDKETLYLDTDGAKIAEAR
jgi:proline dehydrogenase